MIPRVWIVGIFIAGAIMAGVLAALAVQIRAPTQIPEAASNVAVREVAIGTPLDKTAGSSTDLRKLALKYDYGSNEPIGLRITTEAPAEMPLQLTVRLVRPDGTFAQIIPATIPITSGESGYCCWNIVESGRFNLQVFRPDGKLSSIPLRIR